MTGPVAILLAFLLAAILLYNGLVRQRNRSLAAWSQIDVQLKRRHDLVPNLVSTAAAYLKHERETLELVTRARQAAVAAAAGLVASRAAAENGLTRALGSLVAVAERYPELKGAGPMRDLMEQLTTTENRIAFARQHYNDSTLLYNNALESFPGNLLAAAFDFRPREFFEIDDPGERTAPRVAVP